MAARGVRGGAACGAWPGARLVAFRGPERDPTKIMPVLVTQVAYSAETLMHIQRWPSLRCCCWAAVLLRCLGEDRNSFTFEGTCLKKRALLKAAEHPGKVLRAGSVHPRRYATNTSPTGASESCEGVGDCVHHDSQHTSALTQHTNSLQCTFLWSSPFTVSKDGDNFHGRAIRTEKQYLILRVVRHPDPEAVNTIGCME